MKKLAIALLMILITVTCVACAPTNSGTSSIPTVNESLVNSLSQTITIKDGDGQLLYQEKTSYIKYADEITYSTTTKKLNVFADDTQQMYTTTNDSGNVESFSLHNFTTADVTISTSSATKVVGTLTSAGVQSLALTNVAQNTSVNVEFYLENAKLVKVLVSYTSNTGNNVTIETNYGY